MSVLQTNVLRALVGHTRPAADRRHGEYHIACPACGHASSPKDPHCSFGPKGWHCFSCGAGGSLTHLAGLVGLDAGEYTPPAPARDPERRDPARWLAYASELAMNYAAHPRAWELWQSYKPVSQAAFRANALGVGVLPYSKCRHERLIVPIYDGGQIVGLRGRSLGCDCGKWLAPGGTLIELYPLYNQAALGMNQVVWIGENPVDALLLSERTPYAGVATYSVSYWYERWTAALIAARPELVVVAYDNDLPGNGGAARRQEFERAWLSSHHQLTLSAGPKLVNTLRRAGLPAVLYDWQDAPHKSDIGTVIMAGGAA